MKRTKQKRQDLREWCNGLPIRATRALADDERKSLRREFLFLRLRGCTVLGLFPFAFLFAIAFLALLEPSNRGSLPPAFGAILVIFVCIYGLLAVVGFEGYQRSTLLRGDLKSGLVKQYGSAKSVVEGTELPDSDSERAEIEQHPPDFEVLASSGRLWTVAGDRTKKWTITRSSAVADTPAFAEVAANWLQPVAQYSNETIESGQRDLTASECEELRLIAKYTWRKPFWPFILLSSWFYTIAALCLAQHRLPEGLWNRIELGVLGFATITWNGIFIQAILRSKALLRDANAKKVIIGRIQVMEDDDQSPAIFDFEMLPISKLYWTQGLQPSLWRTTGLQ